MVNWAQELASSSSVEISNPSSSKNTFEKGKNSSEEILPFNSGEVLAFLRSSYNKHVQDAKSNKPGNKIKFFSITNVSPSIRSKNPKLANSSQNSEQAKSSKAKSATSSRSTKHRSARSKDMKTTNAKT